MGHHSEEHEAKAGRKSFIPTINNAPPPPKDCGADRCELCVYWHMADPRQKNKSCYSRGFESHDVCPVFQRKPDRVRHDLIQHIQNLTAYEITSLYDILDDRLKQIAQANKVVIRTLIRKADGAVVYWRDDKGKKRAAKVERVTASNVLLKENKSGEEKIRVTEVIEAISKDEYKSRKTGSVNRKEEPGRKIKTRN